MSDELQSKTTELDRQIYHWLINIIVGTAFCYYIWKGLLHLRVSKDLLSVALLLRSCSIAFLFFIRRPSKHTSMRVDEWVIAIVGTFLSHFFSGEGGGPIFPALVPVIYIWMIGTGLLVVAAILSLGRSFGIVPANRGIKTGGMYRFVRHPIYSCYILFDVGTILQCGSVQNIVVFGLYILIFYIRAKQEEVVLRQDAAYEEYARRTRYMFLPGVL